jgi:hypothetical protein
VLNHIVTVIGDTAESSCYVLAQHFFRGAPGGPKFMVGGLYPDQLLSASASCKATRRYVLGGWTDGNQKVAMHKPPDRR